MIGLSPRLGPASRYSIHLLTLAGFCSRISVEGLVLSVRAHARLGIVIAGHAVLDRRESSMDLDREVTSWNRQISILRSLGVYLSFFA